MKTPQFYEDRMNNFRTVEVIEVMKVVCAEGTGRGGDTMRLISWYFDLDGELLFVDDPCKEEPE